LRASNANAANCADAQAMWESVFSLWGSTSGHANMMFHAAGWLEGGLAASFEKFVMDCEVLQQFIYYHQPVSTTDGDLAFDAIREVGSSGHCFGCDHTQSRYRTAFYSPFLSDWRNFESWQEAGSETVLERANKLWKQLIKEYTPPPMEESLRDELEAFVIKRKQEGGAPTDF
jgi:trimethylamine--corrinoid protein Co-methyltransferase